jgi:hypothetical protein
MVNLSRILCTRKNGAHEHQWLFWCGEGSFRKYIDKENGCKDTFKGLDRIVGIREEELDRKDAEILIFRRKRCPNSSIA